MAPNNSPRDHRKTAPAGPHDPSTGVAAMDCAWHRANCWDRDLLRARTIREAYSIGEDYTKHVKKKVDKFVQNVGGEGNKEMGVVQTTQVTVTKLFPEKLFCDFCGIFILDREMQVPFRFCRSCRNQGHKLELCNRCWHKGALDDGSRVYTPKGSPRPPGEKDPHWGSWKEKTTVQDQLLASHIREVGDDFDPHHDHKLYARRFDTIQEAYPDRAYGIKLLKCNECGCVLLSQRDDAAKDARDHIKSFWACLYCRDYSDQHYEFCVRCITKKA